MTKYGSVEEFAANDLYEQSWSDAKGVDLELTPSGNGFYRLTKYGRVYAHGDAVDYGDIYWADGKAVDMEVLPNGDGYLIMTKYGGVVGYGDPGSDVQQYLIHERPSFGDAKAVDLELYHDIKYTDPNDPDTDKDGLLDGWDDDGDCVWEAHERCGEVGDPAQGTWYGNAGSIGRTLIADVVGGMFGLLMGILHRANPLRPDIYVEVDWMALDVNGDGDYDDWWFGEHEHKLSSAAKTKLITVFADHGIRLHIDDGSMGGGGSITHVDNINEAQWNAYTTETGGPNGDEGFTQNRYGIFFYWLIVHDTNEPVDPIDGPIYYVGQEAVSPGWYQVFFDARVGDDATRLWLYMHEFGHAVLGWDIDAAHRRGDTEHCTHYNCAMYESPEGYRGDVNNWNYCSDCWVEISRCDFAQTLP
jgi:hypothetical protein